MYERLTQAFRTADEASSRMHYIRRRRIIGHSVSYTSTLFLHVSLCGSPVRTSVTDPFPSDCATIFRRVLVDPTCQLVLIQSGRLAKFESPWLCEMSGHILAVCIILEVYCQVTLLDESFWAYRSLIWSLVVWDHPNRRKKLCCINPRSRFGHQCLGQSVSSVSSRSCVFSGETSETGLRLGLEFEAKK